MRRLIVVLCAALLWALIAGAQGSSSFVSRFGSRYLQPPCCNGDTLNGTYASISVDYIAPGSAYCVLFRSVAQDSAGAYLLQAGLARCGAYTSLDGTCSLSNNFIKFVEKEVNYVYTCYPHGAATLSTTYNPLVVSYTGNSWSAQIDSTAYESNSFTQYMITEGAEHAGTDSCTGGWAASGFFAGLGAWQRYHQGSGTWKTVQSSYISEGCWTIAGGPPSSFTIYH